MGMDVYGKNPANNTGEYFRANVWSWRPIHKLCETVLGVELHSWGFNDGEGFKSQAECNNLADKLEQYLKQFPNEEISLESPCRIGKNGQFLAPGSMQGKSAYSTNREHVTEFIAFLRACGGFEIC